jgi:hypothetical protein
MAAGTINHTAPASVARPEAGESDVLLGRRGGCLAQVDSGDSCPLSLPETPGISIWS